MRLCGGPTEAHGEQVDPELVRANRRDGESRLPTPASPKTGAQKRSPTRKNSHKTSTLGGEFGLNANPCGENESTRIE